jgi:hypothetical protein
MLNRAFFGNHLMAGGGLVRNSMENQPLKSFESTLRALSASIFIALAAPTSQLPANSQESFNLQNGRW